MQLEKKVAFGRCPLFVLLLLYYLKSKNISFLLKKGKINRKGNFL